MGNESAVRAEGDWDIRGPDFETLLVGPVTGSIIDADRLVRMEWSNGFPNWAMYRVVLAGDTHLAPILREWCVAFAVAYCQTGGVRRHVYSDELACLAGWDAYSALTRGRWVASGADVAEVAEVDPKTYRKLRGALFARLRASLEEYWIRMQVAFRQVALMERWVESTPPKQPLNIGRALPHEIGAAGGGCWVARPLPVKGGSGVRSPDLKKLGL